MLYAHPQYHIDTAQTVEDLFEKAVICVGDWSKLVYMESKSLPIVMAPEWGK